jgi:hypothetical protein
MNWIYVCYVEESRPPLWSRGQSFWLQILRFGFDSRHYQILWEVVGLERGPLSLVSTIGELLERKSSGFDLENKKYGHRDLSRWPRGTFYPQILVLSSSTNGGRSVGIVCSGTQAKEFVFFVLPCVPWYGLIPPPPPVQAVLSTVYRIQKLKEWPRRWKSCKIIVQFNWYLFTCKLNSPEANCRVSRSKEKEKTTNCYKHNRNWRVYIVITIIIIPLE